jgi:hypothetical protein
MGIFYILKANYESAHFTDQACRKRSDGPVSCASRRGVPSLNRSIIKVLEELPFDSTVIVDGSGSRSSTTTCSKPLKTSPPFGPERGISLELHQHPRVE